MIFIFTLFYSSGQTPIATIDDDSFSSYATPMEAHSSGYSTPMFESNLASPEKSLTESFVEEVDEEQDETTVEENSKDLFAIYPNPVSEVINIVGLYQSGTVNFKLFSIDGKQIKLGTIDNSQLNVSDLSRGLYLLQLESDGKVVTEKIIKE